jgi:hypothetical protein
MTTPKIVEPFIVAAAIIDSNDVLRTREQPARHTAIRSMIYADNAAPAVEGFLTNEGVFVNRADAAEIAYRAGQVRWQPRELTTLDLW